MDADAKEVVYIVTKGQRTGHGNHEIEDVTLAKEVGRAIADMGSASSSTISAIP